MTIDRRVLAAIVVLLLGLASPASAEQLHWYARKDLNFAFQVPRDLTIRTETNPDGWEVLAAVSKDDFGVAVSVKKEPNKTLRQVGQYLARKLKLDPNQFREGGNGTRFGMLYELYIMTGKIGSSDSTVIFMLGANGTTRYGLVLHTPTAQYARNKQRMTAIANSIRPYAAPRK
jgi:hypothetical protein